MEMGSSGALVSLWAATFMLLMLGSAAASDAKYISKDTLLSSQITPTPGRKLIRLRGRFHLGREEGCPVHFERMHNYTIVTRRCRGPRYSPGRCCGALLEFACPHADLINTRVNDCAVDMFYNINIHGRYPPGLFATICHGDSMGLQCP